MQDEGVESTIRIEHLADHPDTIPTLAAWAKAQWAHWLTDVPVEKIEAAFERRMTPGRIPDTFVALDSDVPVGTASLTEEDLPARRDLSPWLATVYVLPTYRNRGIGSRLVRAVMEEAGDLAVPVLYLYTPDKVSFYRRLGWRPFAQSARSGDAVTVMVCDPRVRAP
jgi:GNAT superfamily N-acetyltransferase